MCIPVMPWQSSSGPLKPPKMDESGQNLTWPHSKFPGGFSVRSSSPMKGRFNGFISSRFYLFWSFSDYLLYAFASVLLVGVIVLMPLALVCKIWWGNRRYRNTKHVFDSWLWLSCFSSRRLMKRRNEKMFHPLQKSNCVVILWWSLMKCMPNIKLCSHGEIYRDASYSYGDVTVSLECSFIWIAGKTKFCSYCVWSRYLRDWCVFGLCSCIGCFAP